MVLTAAGALSGLALARALRGIGGNTADGSLSWSFDQRATRIGTIGNGLMSVDELQLGLLRLLFVGKGCPIAGRGQRA